MRWNAGGFGTMSFPDAASLAAWKKSKVVHGAYEDWPPELACTVDPDETVTKRLARLAKRDEPESEGIHEVIIDGLHVRRVYDLQGEQFHATAGGVAALIRSAGPYGATGTFYFLGTGGAEELFAHEMTLADGDATLHTLKAAAMRKLYASSDYIEFSEYTFDRTEADAS